MVSLRRRFVLALAQLFILLFGLVSAFFCPSIAAVVEVRPMTFGVIDLHPGGDNIVIAAEKGPADAQGSRSIVHGGHNGTIVLQSSSGTEELVDVRYLDQVPLSCGGQQIMLTNIIAHSQYASTPIELPADRRRIELCVGGELGLSGHEKPCHYSGTMSIQLIYQ